MKQGKQNYGLKYWMTKAGTEYVRARRAPNPIVIHDLRVALRRVRTLSSYLALDQPSPILETIQSLSKPLFKNLAQLRDNQVLQERLKQLRSKNDPAAAKLLIILADEEPRFRRNIRKTLTRFDIRKWKKLTRTVSQTPQVRNPSTKFYVQLASQQLHYAERLHKKARLKPSRKNYHRLRIAFKKYRYLLENLLPSHYCSDAKTLMAVQNALGTYHDLEFLREFIRRNRRHLTAAGRHKWARTIRKKQKQSLKTYHALILGGKRLW
jgi:CHAD domain-containing protein